MTLANTAAAQSGPAAKLAYSQKEAAQALGLGLSTVRRMVAEGQLAHVKAGSRVIIPAQALAQFLAGGK